MTIKTLKKSALFCLALPLLNACCGSGGASSPSSGSTSVAGSTASMLVHGDVLYTLDKDEIKIYNLGSNSQEPTLSHSETIWGAETLYIYENHLYVGGNAGVDIWNIDNPLEPVNVSFYAHIRGCDPVVVDNGIGYVTIRQQPGCWGSQNRLEIVDFSDPSNPEPIHFYQMDFPWGLAKAPDFLAICQEHHGLSLLDVEDPVQIQNLVNYPGINCFDLIYHESTLIATASDGIYQFEASDIYLDNLSQIPVGPQSQ